MKGTRAVWKVTFNCSLCRKKWGAESQSASSRGIRRILLRRIVFLRLDKMTTAIKSPLRGHSLIFVTQFYIIFDPLTLSRLAKCNTTSFTRKLTMCKNVYSHIYHKRTFISDSVIFYTPTSTKISDLKSLFGFYANVLIKINVKFF